MATNDFKVKKGLNIQPVAGSTVTTEGDLHYNDTSNKLEVFTTVAEPIVTETSTATLTNKSISGATNTITAVPGANVTNTASGNLAATNVQAALNELQSDIDTRATAAALTAHEADTTAIHGIADTAALVTLTGAQVLTNKDIDGGTAANTRRITLPKDTLANLQALTRKEGTVAYATDQAKPYFDTGSVLSPIGSGSGTGAVNYASGDNTDFNTALGSAWSTYNDGTAVPVDGDTDGAAPTLTFARTTITPLRGAGSALLTPGALGNGAVFAFTIDRADFASMCEVKFNYEINTPASFTEGDVGVYVISASDSLFTTNVEVVQPTPYKIGKATGQELFKCSFQTHATNTFYRVCLHQITAATGYTLEIDDFLVGPQVSAPLGAPVTDWVSYTPSTDGLGSFIWYEASWRRVGDSMELKGTGYAVTVAATAAAIYLPSGYTYSETSTSTIATYVGELITNGATQNDLKLGALHPTGTKLLFRRGDGSNNGYVDVNGTVVGNGGTVSFKAKVKILGWSSNVQMSDSAETRVVAARLNSSTTSLVVDTPTKVVFATTEYDSNGAVNAGKDTFTAPVAGYYHAEGFCLGASVAHVLNGGNTMYLYKNGSQYTILSSSSGQVAATYYAKTNGSTIVYLNAGDTLSLYVAQGETTGSIPSGAINCWFAVHRLSGPSAIASSEFIAAKVNNSTTTLGNDVPTQLVFGTSEYDTHGGMNANKDEYTAPVSGYYKVSAGILSASIAWANADTLSLYVYKAAVSYNRIAAVVSGTSGTHRQGASGSTTVFRNAGETIRVYAQHPTGGALAGGSLDTWWSVEKFGR